MDSNDPRNIGLRPGARQLASESKVAILKKVAIEDARERAKEMGYDFELHDQDISFLLMCRSLEYGEITLVVAGGRPAVIERGIEKIDLQKDNIVRQIM